MIPMPLRACISGRQRRCLFVPTLFWVSVTGTIDFFCHFTFVPEPLSWGTRTPITFISSFSPRRESLDFLFLRPSGFFVSLALKSIHAQDLLSRVVAFGVLAIIGTLTHGMVDYMFETSPQFGTLFWIVLGLGRRLAGTSSKMVPASAT